MSDAERDDDYDYDDEPVCLRCDGSGEENACCDDLCAGEDECIHGDGIIACRGCDGSGIA